MGWLAFVKRMPRGMDYCLQEFTNPGRDGPPEVSKGPGRQSIRIEKVRDVVKSEE